MADLVEVRVLGTLVVRTEDGTVVDPAVWRTSKTRDLVRLLALRAGQTVAVDTLVEALWPAVDLDRGRASLRTAASQVRQVIGQEHLVRRAGGLVLTGVWVDALAFEALVSTAGQQLATGDTAAAVRSAWDALGLYAADLGEGEPYAEWCASDREHFRRLRRQLVLDAADAAADLGWLRDAVELGHLALRLDPCAERGYRVLMRCYARLGETEQALGMYERCRTALAEAYGADPSRATSDVHLQLLAPPVLPEVHPVLTGRAPVLEQVRAGLDAVLEDGRTAAFLLRGPEGSGRHRLADEVAAGWSGRVERVACRGGQPGALVRVVAGLAHRQPGEPVLLVVEALERAPEQDVLELVRLLHRDAGPLAVVATADDTGLGSSAALLADAPCDVVGLPPLMREEVDALLRAVLGGEPSAALVDELLETSGGRPGAAVRTARALLSSGDLLSSSVGLVRAQGHPRLPVVHAGSLLARAREQTGALGATVLDLLAVLDRRTGRDALAELASTSRADVHAVLHQLCDLGVVDRSEGGYRLQDPAMVEAARSWLRGSARSALHRLIAGQAVLPPGERADHWSAAGEPALACAAWLEAAEDALQRGDDVRGRTFLLRVRQHAEERSVDVRDRIALHERLAEVERRLGRPAEAARLLLQAEELAPSAPPGVQARLRLRRSELVPLFGIGGGSAPRVPSAGHATGADRRAALGRVAGLLPRAPDVTARLLERLVGEADAAEDARCQVEARLLLATAAGALRSSLPTAYAVARTAEALAESLDDPGLQVRAALTAARPSVLLGAGTRERRRLEGLRQRAAELGDVELLADVSLCCCLVRHELGDADLADAWTSVSAVGEGLEDPTALRLLDALVSFERGLLRRTERLLADMPLRFDAVQVDHSALLVRARLTAALDDRAGAVRLLRQVVEDPRLPSPGLLAAEAGARLAVLLADDDPAAARRSLTDAVAAATPRVYPREQVCLLQARAAVASAEGRDEAGATLALASALAAGRAGLVHQSAESHLLRTRLLRRAGKEVRAQRSLEHATDLRRAACGAVPPPREAAGSPGRPLPVL